MNVKAYMSTKCLHLLIKHPNENFYINFTLTKIIKIFAAIKLVEEHQPNSNSPPGNAQSGFKHGNGSGSKFLSVPGKSSFGN